MSYSAYSQGYKNKSERKYSISGETPFFHKNFKPEKTWNIYFITFEYIRKSNTNIYYSNKIGYAPIFKNSIGGVTFISTIGTRIRNSFFEIGPSLTLTHPGPYGSLRLGYRYYLWDKAIFQIAYTPSRWFAGFFGSYDGGPYTLEFNTMTVGLGFQFNKVNPRSLPNFLKRFGTIQLNLYPFLTNPYLPYPRNYSFFFEFDYLLFNIGYHRLFTSFGFGSLASELTFPFGLSYLYGFKNHFLECKLSLMSHHWQDKQYSPVVRYGFLQPQLGYRYNFNKPFFVRVAYAPYFRMVDWKFRDGMEQSMVFGFGYRFQK
jgi:hypothetical protein